MARTAKVLSAAEVRMLSQSSGEYTVGGVSGLRLLVREKPGEKGAFYRSWVLRKQGAKGFKIGLGVYPTIGLKEARELAAAEMQKYRAGVDLVAERRKLIEEAKAKKEAEKPLPTLGGCIEAYFDWKVERGDWKNQERDRRRHELTFYKHVLPRGGGLIVETATPQDIAEILRPIWTELPGTCKKILPQLRGFFFWAATIAGIRPADKINPADQRLVRPYLPSVKAQKKATHYGFLEPDQVPPFVAAVKASCPNSRGCRALLLSILTCVRKANASRARWDQIDMGNALWTIPAEEMKVSGNGQHIVPLSRQAMALLRIQKEEAEILESPYVFVGEDGKRCICPTLVNVAMTRLHTEAFCRGEEGWIDRRQSSEAGRKVVATPHAVARASFETWAHAERKDERTIALCLHHSVDTKYGSAYDRDQSIEMKRVLLQEWADFCLPEG